MKRRIVTLQKSESTREKGKSRNPSLAQKKNTNVARRDDSDRPENTTVGCITTIPSLSPRNKRTAGWVAVSDQIKQAIQAQPDLTLKELQKQLKTSLSAHSLSLALRVTSPL